jgi:hypothetical protein
MIIAFTFLSLLIQAEDSNTPVQNATDSQSPSDTTKKSDDINVSIVNVHHINLDTTQVDGGGNWLNKRLWYERAQNVFDEIRALVNSIGDVRLQFSNEVNAVGHKIDSFFEVVDFNKNELDEKFKEMLVALDTERKIVGDLSAQERTLQETIKQEIKVIEQIGVNIKSIGEVDNKIDETLMQAFKTIDECRDYETKAWTAFKSIGKELDDKKARNLYYQMNNYKQNVEQKITYLKNTLLPYLHNVLVAKIDMNIAKINQSLQDLKTKGIDVQKIMSKTQEDDMIVLQEKEKAAAQVAVRKALEEEEKKSQEVQDQLKEQLKQAQQESFSHVVNSYYQATVGRIAHVFDNDYINTSLAYIKSFFTGFFKSYSYPVITFIYESIIAGKMYVQNLIFPASAGASEKIKVSSAQQAQDKSQDKVQDKSQEQVQDKVVEQAQDKVQEPVVEKSQEPVQDKSQEQVQDKVVEPVVEKAQEQIQDKVVEKGVVSEQKDQGVQADVSVEHSSAPVTQVAAEQSQVVNPVATVATTSQSPLLQAAVSQENNTVIAPSTTQSVVLNQQEQVVVQSLSENNVATKKDEKQSDLYLLFKAFLDFIGTFFVSLYRCLAQFFIFLWKLTSYFSGINY